MNNFFNWIFKFSKYLPQTCENRWGPYRLDLNVHPSHGLIIRIEEFVFEGNRPFRSVSQVSKPDRTSDGMRVRKTGKNPDAVFRQTLKNKYLFGVWFIIIKSNLMTCFHLNCHFVILFSMQTFLLALFLNK